MRGVCVCVSCVHMQVCVYDGCVCTHAYETKSSYR